MLKTREPQAAIEMVGDCLPAEVVDLLHKGCTIAGGFVRDLLTMQPYKDFDVYLPIGPLLTTTLEEVMRETVL